ncbi:hypothetical protein COL154_009049 [Colletotrichum chrysophilum]|uniref:Ecp2 effector protein domain-containing protein n=1 Tax=Colletotrichum chrysophilum TaxID=1836956 RepID=A0AAD9AWI1_9PEZI|nr:hypothetical protein KNSL1_010077 [Colletotrichum chrysophilum]KAJ0358544.1 hypothetical protein COL154_009049 [Colletotrichum chrysophilum]KAK1855893.1 hypothetical protein CCHR01_01443 [Colletotrichum chrysophilum]
MTRRNSLALHLTALAALSSVAQLPILVGAEDLDAEDVPPECVPVCASIVALTARCEAQTKQRFGDIDKRLLHDGTVDFEARRRHVLAPERVRRRRQRLEERMRRRQVQSDSDSDSSGDEAPPQVVAAAEREEKECVCQDTSFDVFGAMNGCAGCIAANVTAVEANEGEFAWLREGVDAEADLGGRYQGDHGRLRVCSSTASGHFFFVYYDNDNITTAGDSYGPSGREPSPGRILDVSAPGISARGTVYVLDFINILNGTTTTTAATRCPDLNATTACCRDDAGARGHADGGELDHARDGVRDAFFQDAA